MDIREEQYRYEEEADVAAAAKKLQELRVESSEGSLELPRATRLVAHMFGEVQDYLQAECDIKTRGPGGSTKNWLRALPLDVAAIIAIRECISMLSSANSMSIQTLATQIGRMWETEIRVREAEKVNPMYMQKIAKQLKDRNTVNKDHIRKVYDVAYKRVMKDVFDSSLGPTELIQLGKYGVQACMSAGMVYNTVNTANLSTVVQYWLTPEVLEFLTDYTNSDVRSIMDKAHSAMLCPPDPWTNISEGGYLSPRRKLHSPLLNLTHVRMSERPRLRELFTDVNMPMVFRAGNYLQSVAYTLHKPTLDAMTRVWQAGGGVLGVPTKNPPAKPECPFPATWVRDDAPKEEQAEFALWKRKAVLWYEQIKSWKGHVRELGGHMRISQSHVGRPIWFPMYLDTRGRWYYRGVPNPQGSDLARSVLHLHQKKPLGHRGLFWLKVAIANHYGFDKDRFVDRAAWTDKHWKDIERALDEPENHPDVWGTDAPWCMYSAAWELREAYRSGNPNSYCTGVVVHMDATCSGLQHFSALLRDPVGGQCVNLTDDLKCGPKQDIYSKVSAIAMQSLMQDLDSTDPEVVAMAKWWMPIGIPRALAKKPVKIHGGAINCVNSGNTQNGQS